MKILGITGGIGSGKSIVCKIFSQLGIPVYEADREVKQMYAGNEALLELLHKKFPAEIFNKDGKPDSKKFAAYFFDDASALEQLNALVHPYVRKHFSEWCQVRKRTPYVIKEAAILFESESDKGCDRIATITAPEEMRIMRVRERDQRSRNEIMKIISRQWSDEQRNEKSDFVIANDESQMLLPQVLNVHRQMLKLANGDK